MESKELRIGNWVYNETTRENMQVYPMMIPQLNRLDGTSHNIKPIPLTEELLIKCGFLRGSVTMYFLPIPKLNCEIHATWFHNQYVIELQNDRVPIVTEVSNLHQLQNLHFALTGQELEIKF